MITLIAADIRLSAISWDILEKEIQ